MGQFLCVVLVLVVSASCEWPVLVPAGQWIPACAGMTGGIVFYDYNGYRPAPV